MFTLVSSAHMTAYRGLHLTSLFKSNVILSLWHSSPCDLTFIFLTALVCLWCIINLIHPEQAFAVAFFALCACLLMYACICRALLCSEVKGRCRAMAPGCWAERREAGGCSGSLWQWSWGVCVCPGRRTPPLLPPPPHTPLWWTTQRRKWTSHALTHARVKSKKVCCMCTVMGGASLMSARYHPCSFMFHHPWSCTTLYCNLAHYPTHISWSNILSLMWLMGVSDR